MEDKKQIKISKKTAIIIVCIIFIIVIIAIYFKINKKDVLPNSMNESQNSTDTVMDSIDTPQDSIDVSKYAVSDTVSVKNFKNKDYYIIEKDYAGSYDLRYLSLSQYFNSSSDIRNTFEVNEEMSYEDYKSYCDKWGIKAKYADSTKNYIVYSYLAYGIPNLYARLAAVEYNDDNQANLYIWEYESGATEDISAFVLVIPTDQNIDSINIVPVNTNSEYLNIQKKESPSNSLDDCSNTVFEKPIIYLYPKEDTEVSVKLLKEKNIICSYPKYKDEWKVLASPNGSLKDLETERQLYSLYYEGKNDIQFKVEKEGFVVKGEDTISFLEEKLAILGLTEREAEEFIVYWLPKLEANKYNYIRFATTDEINESMPLEIHPNPDTVIRVLMTFKGLEKPIDVQEQQLEIPRRTGFVAAEWGGTEIQ